MLSRSFDEQITERPCLMNRGRLPEIHVMGAELPDENPACGIVEAACPKFALGGRRKILSQIDVDSGPKSFTLPLQARDETLLLG